MSRDNERDFRFYTLTAAATAATTTTYQIVADRPVDVKGFCWSYESAEANTNNTLDFKFDYSTDGTNFTTIFDNVNPNGLLDTGAVLAVFDKMGNAGSSGATAVTVASSFPGTTASLVGTAAMRIPANALVRMSITTAGTGTVPAIDMLLYGTYV